MQFIFLPNDPKLLQENRFSNIIYLFKKIAASSNISFLKKITLVECGSTFTFITSLLLVFDVYLCMLKTKLSTQNAKNEKKNEILNERIFFLKYLEIFKKSF